MFGKTVAVLAFVGLVAGNFKPKHGVDPNTLSCDPLGLDFLLLPDWTDCQVFYKCAHGQEVLHRCSEPLIFDFELQGCDWAFSGTCTLRGTSVEGSGDEGSGDDSGIFGLDEFAADPEPQQYASILDCFRSENKSKQLPYKGDCQRYWRCTDGTLETARCSDGLFFNSASSQCDFEANVKCDEQINDELDGEFMLYK